MTKNTDPIAETELFEYLNSDSDFSFELSVLKMLREEGIECEHAGHYVDRVTNKSREFDIRAKKTFQSSRIRMAIECKNIREYSPILVSCVPRQKHESYHQIALLSDHMDKHKSILKMHPESRAQILSICEWQSLYRVNEPVGKSTAQVMRSNDGTIVSKDSEIYEKWGQCLSSANDLVDRIYFDGFDEKEVTRSAVFPFVVVPNGRLWIVTYDADGNRICNPKQSDRVSFYTGKDYQMGTQVDKATLCLSHVEIVTFDGMKSFVQTYLQTKEGQMKVFPPQGIANAISCLK